MEKWRENTLGKSPPLITEPATWHSASKLDMAFFSFSTASRPLDFINSFMLVPRPPLLDAGNLFYDDPRLQMSVTWWIRLRYPWVVDVWSWVGRVSDCWMDGVASDACFPRS